MRMIHVIPSLKPDAGSVAISLTGLFPALKLHDIDCEIVTLDSENPCTNGDDNKFPSHRFDSADAVRLLQQADLIHLHGWDQEICRPAAAIARKSKTPYLLSPHGQLTEGRYQSMGWRDKLRGFLGDNKLIKSAAAMVTSNKQESVDLSSRSLHSNIRELPIGLSFNEYTSTNESPPDIPSSLRDMRILLLGPIDPIEGCVVLLRAVAELGPIADDWSIVLAGQERGDWRKMLEAAVRRKGGEKRVLFTDAPDVSTQKSWLSQVSLLVAPGLHVQPNVSIMQAVAMGIPVIASDCVAPDSLSHLMSVCGPTKPQLQRALRSTFENGEKVLLEKAKEAKELGLQRLDWSNLLHPYVDLYRSVSR